MRHNLDESPHSGDLELIGMLPAELRELCIAFKAMDVAVGPMRARSGTGRGGSGDAVFGEVGDRRRENLRRFRESTRQAIRRLTASIEKQVREVKRCPKCGAENSWDDAWCGESFPPPERGCGYIFQKPPARTHEAKP